MRRAALSPKPFLSRALPLASSPSLPPFHEDLLRFKLPHSVQDVSGQTPTGYAPPRGGTEDLPFRVIRTRSGNLPVYTAYKNGRTKKVTILRKFLGDSKILREEVWRLLGQHPRLQIKERAGSLEIKGDCVWQLEMWLKRLGF